MSQEEEFVTPRNRSKPPVPKTDTELALEAQFPEFEVDPDAGRRRDAADEVPTP